MSSDTGKVNYWERDGDKFVTPIHDTYPFISAHNAGSMRGKSVLITGASKGIGLMMAVHFAKAGCSMIALAARSSMADAEAAVKKAAAEVKTTPKILCLKVDVASDASVKAAAEKVRATFDGRLDVLVNNAGYLSDWQKIGDSDPLEYWKTWEININGTYLCTRYFLPLLLASELKTVVNFTSAGAVVTIPTASSYQSSKFAVCRFTEFLDVEYADSGLITFGVHPGGIRTELALNMPEWMYGILTDTPELAADTVIWLCKERREWLRGRFISATWNMEELEGRKEEIVKEDKLKFRMAF